MRVLVCCKSPSSPKSHTWPQVPLVIICSFPWLKRSCNPGQIPEFLCLPGTRRWGEGKNAFPPSGILPCVLQQPFPKKFPFSEFVPKVYSQIKEFIYACLKFSEDLHLRWEVFFALI